MLRTMSALSQSLTSSCPAPPVSLCTARLQVVPALHPPPSRALYSLSSACVSLPVPSSFLTYLMILLLQAQPCSARVLTSASDLRLPLFPPVFPLAPPVDLMLIR